MSRNGRRSSIPAVDGAGAPVVCPYCGDGLLEGRLHACPEMRSDVEPEPFELRFTPRLAGCGLVILSAMIAAYLGAHVLVALGVGS